MKFDERKSVMDRILLLEQSYPVGEWRISGVQFWPIIKNQLFFHQFKTDTLQKEKIKIKLWIRLWRFIIRKIRRYRYKISVSIKPTQFIFSGAYTHEVGWKGKKINRYFTPIIEYLKSKNSSTLLVRYNRGESNDTAHNESLLEARLLIDFYTQKLPFEQEWQRLLSNENFGRFYQHLSDLFPSYSKVSKSRLSKSLHAIIAWKRFYSQVFKQAQPSVAFGLCYYSNEMFGMNLAAKELGITSVDMQHGTIGELHVAYSFSSLPKNGYDLLPDEFWVWDLLTYEYLKKQFSANSNIAVKLSGNPWLREASQSVVYSELDRLDKPMVLYTHQPLRPPIDSYLLETIGVTKSKYAWWLRLHPKTSAAERSEIHNLLAHYDLLHVVEIDNASELPLPILLSKAAVHISKFSGSIIEAALMGVPNIVLEEVGTRTFEELIADNKAIGIEKPTKEILIDCIQNSINRMPKKNNAITDFRQHIDALLT
jgi:hypothetical protein